MKDIESKGRPGNGTGISHKSLIYLASTFAIILWGISYIWTDRLISLGISVFYFVFARTVLAGIVLLLFNAACGNLVPIQKKDLPKFLLLAFCEPFIYFLCESYGVKETGSPTLSAMIIATIPIFSIGAGIIFFKEKISALNVTGILMSLAGIVMVVMAKGELGEHFVLGIVLLLTAVISEVGHASLTKSLSGNYSSQVIVMYQFLIGSVYLLPLFITKGLDGFSWATHMGLNVWYPIIFLGVFCSSIAFFLWVRTIKQLGVARSSIFSALIPVVAAVIAWLFGHESMNLRQFLGIILATAGVILSQHCPHKTDKR